MCMSMSARVCTDAHPRRSEEGVRVSQAELKAVVRHFMWVLGAQVLVLHNTSKHSQALGHLSGPTFSIMNN